MIPANQDECWINPGLGIDDAMLYCQTKPNSTVNTVKRRLCVIEQVVSNILPDRARPIVVYCAQVASSAVAAKMLQKLAYQKVFLPKGGLFGWLEAGGILRTCKRS